MEGMDWTDPDTGETVHIIINLKMRILMMMCTLAVSPMTPASDTESSALPPRLEM